MIVQLEHIEQALTYFEKDPEKYTEDVSAFVQTYPNILQYIYSDNFSLLSEDERHIFEYVSWVIIKAIEQAKQDLEDAEAESIGGMEEQHWKMLQETEKLPFRDRMTPFFEAYDEEEVLAFVEDSLEEDEEYAFTKEIRELLLVGLTTIGISLIFAQKETL